MNEPLRLGYETEVDRLRSVQEVAERLRRSEQSMRWMIHKGTAPKSAIVGGRRMFRESDVEAWISEQFDKASA